MDLRNSPLDLVGCSVVLTEDDIAAEQFATKDTKNGQ